jgi:Bacterial transcriptional activator domain
MPHELIAGLEAAALMLLVLLLVPKRGLDHLRARFSALEAGRRRWLFDPPSWIDGRRSEGVQKLARDAVEAFELGVPLFVAGRLAEQRSAQLHMERQSHWTDSPKALMAAHLKGALSEHELHDRLKSRELPLPAAKAVLAKVEARPLISIKWWLERQAMAHAMAESNGQGTREQVEVGSVAEEGDDEDIDEESEDLDPTSPTSDPGHLRIRTFGRLQLLQAGHDYGPELMSKKVLAFIWLYPFVRRLLDPDGHVKRAAFAEELSPGLSPVRQNKRLRDRLGDMYKRDLPPVLSGRLIADRQELHLDLSNCSIDVVRLQEVARLCTEKHGMLTDDSVAEARRILDETEGEFLPEWDDIEKETNGGRSAAAREYIRAAREMAETARVDLMGALAANHMARQEPRKAIPLLEKALEHQPEREDLARKLIAAYLETGQHAKATELQKDHALDV